MEPIVITTFPGWDVNSMIVPLADGKAFVVDPAACEIGGDENAIIDRLEAENLSPIAIVITHGHFDHVCGIKTLVAKYPNLPVLIHRNGADRLGKNSVDEQSKQLKKRPHASFVLPAVSDLPEPAGFLEHKKTLFDAIPSAESNFSPLVCDALKEWQVIFTPGHSADSVCILNEKEKVIIAGDTIFYYGYPATDLPGGSISRLSMTYQELAVAFDSDVRIYPGHDKVGFTTKDYPFWQYAPNFYESY